MSLMFKSKVEILVNLMIEKGFCHIDAKNVQIAEISKWDEGAIDQMIAYIDKNPHATKIKWDQSTLDWEASLPFNKKI